MGGAGYEAWNRELARRYFSSDQAGRPVYLDSDDALLSSIAAEMGVEDWRNDLADAVRESLLLDGSGVLDGHLRATRKWRAEAQLAAQQRTGISPPPTVALLTQLSAIAGDMGEDEDLAVHAYYPLVARRLHLDEIETHGFIRGYQKHGEYLWRSVNDYLSMTDGTVGTPTAYSLGHRFVGLPQSQALVRAVDRERLPYFFRRFGLAPGSDMVPEDLTQLLNAWITQTPTPVSANLRRLWDRDMARGRIASVVATELSSWDGTLPSTTSDGPSAGLLQLAALLQNRLGGRRVELTFLVALPGGCSDGVSVLSSPESPRLDLQQVGGGRARPRVGAVLDLATLIEAPVSVADLTSGEEATRTPRRVVPMRKDDLLGYHVEVERVNLGEDHLLWVKDDQRLVTALTSLLNGAIGRYAAVYTSDGSGGTTQLAGIPGGWRLYESVQVFARPETEPSLPDLNALLPLASAQLTFNGGLRLPGRVRKWSSLNPPEIRAVVADAVDLSLELRDGEGQLIESWHTDQPVIVGGVAGTGVSDGDYLVLLRSGKREVAQHTMRLRSADIPDAMSWEVAARLLHDLSNPLGAISATDATASEDAVLVDGPWATPIEPASRQHGIPTSPSWDKSRKPATARLDVRATPLGQIDTKSCAVTGAHRTVHPSTLELKEIRGSWYEVTCTQCGLVMRHRRSAKKRVAKKGTSPTPSALDIDLTALPPMTRHEIDWDEALDALIHVGGGPLSALERIASQVEASSLFADDFLRTLEVLGHIDVMRDDRLRPIQWEVPPMYLAGMTEDRWRLCGAWSNAERAELGRQVSQVGGKFTSQPYADQPTEWLVADVDEAVLSEMCEAQGSWTLAPDAAERLAATLPSISDLRSALPLVDLPNYSGSSRFDVSSASWMPSGGVIRPGAYRLSQSFGSVDVHIDDVELSARHARLGTVQLVKHLEAQAAGAPLCYYHSGASSLVVPLGADLPGLFGRAAVLCSGERPKVSARLGFLVYPSVTRAVADQIADCLYR